MMQAASRHSNPLRHSTIDTVTESQPFRTKVILARSTVGALATDPCRGFAGNTVALAKTVSRSAHLRNYAAEFVAQNHRDVDWPTLRVVKLVNLASADPNCGAAQQHFVVSQLGRSGDLTQLDSARLERVVDHRGHGFVPHASCLQGASNPSSLRSGPAITAGRFGFPRRPQTYGPLSRTPTPASSARGQEWVLRPPVPVRGIFENNVP